LRVNRAAQMPRDRQQDAAALLSPNGNCSTTSARDISFAGHCFVELNPKWSLPVRFSDVAAFPESTRTVIHRAEHHAVLCEKPVVAVLGQGPSSFQISLTFVSSDLKCTVARYGDAAGDNTGRAFSCI